MKPFYSHDVEDFLSDGPLLLLDTSMVAIHWMHVLIAGASTNIQSRGGIALPTELWLQIFDFTVDDTTRSFCFVQASLVSSEPSRNPTSQVIRCMRTEFDTGHFIANAETIAQVEGYMRTPRCYDGIDLRFQQLSGPENTFYVKVDSCQDRFVCLYFDIGVPDIISRLEGGHCWLCDNNRYICPGCDGSAFGVSMECGWELACPLCMGLDIAEYHKAYHEKPWTKVPYEELRNMQEKLYQRLKELSYPLDALPTPSQSQYTDSE